MHNRTIFFFFMPTRDLPACDDGVGGEGVIKPTAPRSSIFCEIKNCYLYCLKVVGNEKLGGLKFLQLLGIDLGPWRSMSIFILNVPFSIEKRISISALSSKMNRRLVCN
jgi:hypothetical protein